jgi:hypothetical protein
LQLIDHRVGIECNFAELIGYLLLIVWMRVPDTDDGVPTIEVQILLALVVPYLAAFALHDVYIEERIYIE